MVCADAFSAALVSAYIAAPCSRFGEKYSTGSSNSGSVSAATCPVVQNVPIAVIPAAATPAERTAAARAVSTLLAMLAVREQIEESILFKELTAKLLVLLWLYVFQGKLCLK
jgi:hypothetical protein